MTTTNGNSKWTFWLVGLLSTLILVVTLPTMARQIWENDRRNITAREKISETMIARDEKLAQDIASVKDISTSIKMEVIKQGTILERIERKL